MLKNVEDETETLSKDEVRKEIQAFTRPEELLKLKKIAARLSGNGLDPEDLIQEAICLALEQRRKCPKGVNFLVFLANAMRSIACNSRKKRTPENVIAFSKDEQTEENIGHFTSSPEEDSLAEEQRQSCAIIIQEIYHLFENDETATIILMGKEDNLSAKEIRDLYNIDETTYNSACRRIRRKVDMKYPEGWRKK